MHRKTVIDFRDLGERYVFTQPIKELKTRDLAEVTDLLAQVESYQEQGYYVVGYVSYEAAPAFEEKLAVHEGPLLGEYLLYFTVHNSVETSNIPLTYEEVELPSNWQEVTSAENYEKAITQNSPSFKTRRYLSGQLYGPTQAGVVCQSFCYL